LRRYTTEEHNADDDAARTVEVEVAGELVIASPAAGGAWDRPAGPAPALPLQVRVALVAGGVMQPLWALYGRDEGDHIAALLMPDTETRDEGGEEDEQAGDAEVEADMNALVDALCANATAGQAALVDPHAKRSKTIFERFPGLTSGRGGVSDRGYPWGGVDKPPPMGSGAQAVAAVRGGALQVDPIKHMLKAPGTKRLKLKYDNLLLYLAFNFNLC